jgi:phosphatidylglycerol:prolipoprotein diacylglycerol transferase
MYPELFKIGSLTFYTHGVLAVFGIFLGSLAIYLLARKEKIKNGFLFDNVVYSVLVGIIFARITYFFVYSDQFSSIKEIFYIWQGGMVSYGGFIPGFITFILLLKAQKAQLSRWLAISAIAFPIGLFWGRIGNIFAGEYSGVLTTSKFNLGGVIPVPLYEATLLVLIIACLLLMYKKWHKLFEQYSFFIFILSYTLGRFIIDFWRDESKILFNISLGQMVSLLIFIITAIFLVYGYVKERRKNATI